MVSTTILTSTLLRLDTPIFIRVTLPPIARRAERLQIARVQAQIPVLMERLDVIDIHVGSILGGRATGQGREGRKR